MPVTEWQRVQRAACCFSTRFTVHSNDSVFLLR